MHISILKSMRLGSTNLQTQKDQREIKECLHIQNTKQIKIINLFNETTTVAGDASLGLQICGPKDDPLHNGNVHYKMEGVNYVRKGIHIPFSSLIMPISHVSILVLV